MAMPFYEEDVLLYSPSLIDESINANKPRLLITKNNPLSLAFLVFVRRVGY